MFDVRLIILDRNRVKQEALSEILAARVELRPSHAAGTGHPRLNGGPDVVAPPHIRMALTDLFGGSPGHVVRHGAVSDGPDKACPCESGGRAMTNENSWPIMGPSYL
jgi:hypothetical protein